MPINELGEEIPYDDVPLDEQGNKTNPLGRDIDNFLRNLFGGEGVGGQPTPNLGIMPQAPALGSAASGIPTGINAAVRADPGGTVGQQVPAAPIPDIPSSFGQGVDLLGEEEIDPNAGGAGVPLPPVPQQPSIPPPNLTIPSEVNPATSGGPGGLDPNMIFGQQGPGNNKLIQVIKALIGRQQGRPDDRDLETVGQQVPRARPNVAGFVGAG